MYGYKRYQFYLNISKEQLLTVYQGHIHKLVTKTDQGMTLQLDANHLRKFTTNNGIQGRFELVTTSSNKFVSLNKIG